MGVDAGVELSADVAGGRVEGTGSEGQQYGFLAEAEGFKI
jgi:hypothetical protein